MEDLTVKQVRELVEEYKAMVAEARSTYMRTEFPKMWLADAIIDLFKDEFKEEENDEDAENDK